MSRGQFKPLVVVLDLEFNQPSRKIIQIGAVIGDLRSKEILSEFSAFINPEEPLNPEIATLCGVTDEVLSLAGTLQEAYDQLLRWLAPYADQRQLNPLTWGGGDSAELKAALGLTGGWAFGRRWVDVKTLYTGYCHAKNIPAEGGLKASMRKMRLVFDGYQHDAKYDCRNTFRMYVRLLEEFKKTLNGQELETQELLKFVLAYGVPMKRDGQYRYHGVTAPVWQDTEDAAIRAAIVDFTAQGIYKASAEK